MIHIDAIYNDGVLCPLEPLALPEGTRVHLCVEQPTAAEETGGEPADGELPTLLERMKEFVGTVHNLPQDASDNLDHYLYGIAQ